MRNIQIRPATAEDVKNIQSITLEAFNKYALDLGMPEKVTALYETEADILSDIENKHVLVGFLDGEMMGSIRFDVITPELAYISRFGVRLIGQGCGMGRALMSAVADACRAMGVKAIALHTSSRMSSLVRFYYGQGYYVHSTLTGKGYIRALMVKDLVPGQWDLTPVLDK